MMKNHDWECGCVSDTFQIWKELLWIVLAPTRCVLGSPTSGSGTDPMALRPSTAPWASSEPIMMWPVVLSSSLSGNPWRPSGATGECAWASCPCWTPRVLMPMSVLLYKGPGRDSGKSIPLVWGSLRKTFWKEPKVCKDPGLGGKDTFQWWRTFLLFKIQSWASLVAQWLRSACQFRGHGFQPRSRKIPHAVEQLSPWATTTEPAL